MCVCLRDARCSPISPHPPAWRHTTAHRGPLPEPRPIPRYCQYDGWVILSSCKRKHGDVINPPATVLDSGGGAGRFALPLALQCQHVTVIEPSPSMRESLRQIAMEADIDNVTIAAKRWENAEVNPADVVISALEIDPAFTDRASLLVDRRDQQPRSSHDGPLQVIVAW